MSYDLFEKYQELKEDSSVATRVEYFQFIDKLKYYFLNNGILYDEEKKILNKFLSLFEKRVKKSIRDLDKYLNGAFIDSDFCRLFIKKDEAKFIDKYILPELFKHGLDIIIYEADSINLKTYTIDDCNRTKFMIRKPNKIYGCLSFSQILRETTRIKSHYTYNNSNIEMKIEDKIDENQNKTNKIIRTINRIFDKDSRIYRDVIGIIDSYLKNICSEVDITISKKK